MKRTICAFISLLVAAFLAGCGAPAGNTAPNSNSNTNTNSTSRSTSAAPTADEFMAMEKKANDAYFKGDKAFFEDLLSDKYTGFHGGKRTSRSEDIGQIAGVKCDVKSSSTDDPHISKITDEVYAFSYRAVTDGSCTENGKTESISGARRAVTFWTHDGDKWKALYHDEVAIMDPNSPPPPPAKKEEPKKVDPKAVANTSEPAKEAAPAATAPAADANTDALVKLHQAGWEAFKAKDAKWFEANIGANFAGVDPGGAWMASKADAIKGWTSENCEGMTTVKVSNGIATSIAPNVELLTLTGTADGTCNGQKNGDLYQAAVYVKDGDAWKIAFMIEAPKT